MCKTQQRVRTKRVGTTRRRQAIGLQDSVAPFSSGEVCVLPHTLLLCKAVLSPIEEGGGVRTCLTTRLFWTWQSTNDTLQFCRHLSIYLGVLDLVINQMDRTRLLWIMLIAFYCSRRGRCDQSFSSLSVAALSSCIFQPRVRGHNRHRCLQMLSRLRSAHTGRWSRAFNLDDFQKNLSFLVRAQRSKKVVLDAMVRCEIPKCACDTKVA